MKTIPIKGLGKEISQLSMGTATSTLEGEGELHEMLDHYVLLGGNNVDTARFYGRGSGVQRTEEMIGRWLRRDGNRDKVIVTSKCCNPYIDRNGHMHDERFRVGRVYMQEDLDYSQDQLGIDAIDIYLTHRDDPKVPVAEIMDTFEEFRIAGRIRAYGMSNWRLDRIIEAYDYCERMGYQGPSVVSPFFSLVKLEIPWYYRIPPFREEWLGWFDEHRDVLLVCWAPQGRGFFGGYPNYEPENADPTTRAAVLTPENFRRRERVRELSAIKGIGPSQISLAYVLSQPFPTVGVIGPRSVGDIDKVVAASRVELTRAECDYLTLRTDHCG